MFIALNGFVEAKFIVPNPDTIIGLGSINPITLTFLSGLLITSVLIVKKVKSALIIGIFITTLLSIPIGRLYGDASAINNGIPTLVTWNGCFSAPDFSLLFSLDLLGSLKLSFIPTIFAFLFVDLIDSLSTFIGIAEASGMKDENGEPRNMKQSLIVDSISTLISGLFGTSSGSSYIESAAGIAQGGKTGLTAVIAGLLFLPFMFLSPLISIIPSIATAPALVIVGVFMISPIANIKWKKLDDAIPAFITIMMIPLAFSITQGIIWGLLSWTLIKLFTGKYREIHPVLLVIDFLIILNMIL